MTTAAEIAHLQEQGLYSAANEHDACGVGFVAHIKGEKSHGIVQQGLKILENLDHRGAVGADKLMGDGAGILIQLPDEFYRADMAVRGIELPPVGEYGVGMIFLPKEHASRLACRVYVELAPVRAGLASEAAAYPWSSAAHHAGLRRDALVTPHPLDWQLGNTPFEREVARNVLLDRGLAPDVQRGIDAAVEKGWALGGKTFMADVEQSTGRRAQPATAGRPVTKSFGR